MQQFWVLALAISFVSLSQAENKTHEGESGKLFPDIGVFGAVELG